MHANVDVQGEHSRRDGEKAIECYKCIASHMDQIIMLKARYILGFFFGHE